MTLISLATAPGQRLRADAAAAWDRVAREVQRRYGRLPVLTDSARPIEVQERIFLDRYDAQITGGGFHNDVRTWKGVRYVRRRYRKSDGAPAAAAAVPGTSRHGPGLAVDASGLGGFTGTRYRQLMAVQAEHGWSNAAGRTINEAWHQEYDPEQDQHRTAGGGSAVTPAPAPTTPTSQEDDMPLTNDDLDKIAQRVWAFQNTKLERDDAYALLRAARDGTVTSRQIHDLFTPGKTKVKTEGDILGRLVRIERAVSATSETLAKVATAVAGIPLAVWGYRNAKLERDDVYALFRSIRDKVVGK